MQDFLLWNRVEVVEFIKTIEQAIGTGTTQVTNAGAGGMMFRDIGSMYKTLRRLYRRLGQIDGKNYGTSAGARTVNVVIDNGYRRQFRFRGRC